MGLLDVFNSDQGRLGLSLLAAAGPRMDGAGFGQRMQEALGSVDAWKQNQMKRQMFAEDLALKKLAEQRAQRQFDMQNKALEMYMGGQSQPTTGQQSQDASSAPGQPVVNRQSMGVDQLRSLEAMAIAGVPGAKELFDIYKYKNEPTKLEQGATYENRVTGKREFMPKVGEGIGPDGNGAYGALPGYANAQALIEGAKAKAVEGAKAALDPLTYTPAGGTNPVMSSRAAVMGAQVAPQASVMPSGYAGGSRAAAGQGQLEILRQELAKPGISPEDRAAVEREMARLVGNKQMTPQGGLLLQSPAEAAKLVGTANADVVRDTTKQLEGKRFGQMMSAADRASELLKSGPTASGAGSLVDSAASFFGGSTKGADLASQLETLSGWMTSNVPRMEGPQSDKDVAQYRIMAAAVGDKTRPISQRLAAVDELRRLQNKYAELNGYANSGGATGDFGGDQKPSTPRAPQGAVNMLKMNPKLADAFDQKYGAGAAAAVLGR